MDVKYEVAMYDVDTGYLVDSEDGYASRADAERRCAAVEEGYERYCRTFPYGECCGNQMYLMAFTNTCDVCGRDYNSSGQLLAPRSQWGEETGEPWDAGDVGYANPDAAFGEDY